MIQSILTLHEYQICLEERRIASKASHTWENLPSYFGSALRRKVVGVVSMQKAECGRCERVWGGNRLESAYPTLGTLCFQCEVVA
jgi:hypothetical protein